VKDTYNHEDIRYEMHLFTRDDLQKFVRRSVDSYYNLDNKVKNSVILENYTLFEDDGRPFEITARYFYISKMFNDTINDRYEVLTQDNIALYAFAYNTQYRFDPDRDDDLKDMLSRIEFFTIDYAVKNTIPWQVPASANCYLWNITQVYNFADRGYIRLTLQMDRQVCDADYDNIWVNMVWIPILNLIFSTISLASIIKYFFDITRQFNKLKSQYRDKQATLETTK